MKEKRESLIKGIIIEKGFSRTYRFLIFIILFILSFLIQGSHMLFIYKNFYGSMMKHLEYLIEDEKIFDLLKIIGVISSDFAFIIISRIENRKIVTFICFLLNGIIFFIYCLAKTKLVSYVIIFYIHVLKEYRNFFIPVWIDQFNIKKFKGIFMFIFLFNMNYNFLEGFLLSFIYKRDINFGILGGLIIFFDCLLLIFPDKYFSSKYNFIGYKVQGNEEFTKVENSGQISFFEKEDYKSKSNEIGFLKTILNNKVYVFPVLANICYLFAHQGICMKMNKLQNDDYNFRKIILRTIFLGFIYIKGYENKNFSIFLSIFAIFSFLGLLIITYLSYEPSFIFYIGMFLHAFSLHMNIINKCFIVNCIPNKYKGPGLALDILLENISKMSGSYSLEEFRFDLVEIIYIVIYIPAIIFCFYSSFYRYRDIKNENENKLNNFKEKELENIENM